VTTPYAGRMRSADTLPKAYARQIEVYRSMSPGRRVEIGIEMSEESFRVMAAGIQTRHPAYDRAQVEWALRRLRVGDELFQAAWPDAPLVAP
jgi:hypothetical protein